MTIKRNLEWVYANPKILFPIDGFGAVLSAIMLGVVFVEYEFLFGIPKSTLYFLASLPCIFAVYDFYCYFIIDNKIGRYLKIIAYFNLIYCCLSIGFSIYHIEKIETLAWVYIMIEVIIVSCLSIIELKVATKIKS